MAHLDMSQVWVIDPALRVLHCCPRCRLEWSLRDQYNVDLDAVLCPKCKTVFQFIRTYVAPYEGMVTGMAVLVPGDADFTEAGEIMIDYKSYCAY